MTPAQFPFGPGPAGRTLVAAPAVIRLTLELGAVRLAVDEELDPNVAISILPHSLGLRLGAVWSPYTTSVSAPGRNTVQAIPLAVTGIVASLPAVRLAFAWASTDAVPVVLGRKSFFDQFDVCFHLDRGHVEVQPAVRPGP